MDTIVTHVLPERFWAKVEKTDGCWGWTAYKNSNGYGTFRFEKNMWLAHRLAYSEANGPIPPNMFIDHRCHNPGCVRPDHLRLVTNKQNSENLTGAYANSKSGVRGISWSKHAGKWRATIKHNGLQIHVGLFVHLSDAEAAVTAKRNELFTHNDHDRTGRISA